MSLWRPCGCSTWRDGGGLDWFGVRANFGEQPEAPGAISGQRVVRFTMAMSGHKLHWILPAAARSNTDAQ